MADLYYIEDGYFDPSLGYFVYTADAAAAIASSATISCDAELLAPAIEASADLSSAFTQTAIVYRTQDSTAALSSTSELTSIASKTQDCSAALSSEFTTESSAGKIIEAAIAVDALFSPGVTANVSKNLVAIMDIIAEISATPMVNRSTSITTTTIADLNAQAAKAVDVQTSMATSTSISIAANKTTDTSLALNSEFTQTTEVVSPTLAEASLSVTSSVYVSKLIGTGRPRNATNSQTYSTSIKKFGSASSQVGGNTPSGYLIPEANQSFVYEWWNYVDTLPTSFPVYITFNSGNKFFRLFYNSNGRLTLNSYKGTTTTTSTANNILTLDTWQHIAVVYSSGRLSIYVAGTRVITQDLSALTSTDWDGFGTLIATQIYAPDSNGGAGYVDEASIHWGTTLGFDPTQTTITPPTTTRTNDPTTTKVLWHFDESNIDDISEVLTSTASLTSSLTSTIVSTVSKDATAALNAQTTLSAQVSNVVSSSATFSSEFAQVSSAGIVKNTSSDIQSQSSLESVGNKTTSIDISCSSSASLSADAYRIKDFNISCDALFSPSITAEGIKNHTAILETTASLSADISYVAGTAVDMSTSASLLASVIRIQDAAAAMSSQSELSASAERFRDTSADVSAETSLTAINGLELSAQADIDSASSLTADAVKTTNISAAFSATATLAATTEKFIGFSSSQSSAFTTSATVTRIKALESQQSSNFSQSTAAVKTTGNSSALTSAFSSSIQAVKTVDPQINTEAIATEITAAAKNATGTILLESSATLTALVGKITEYQGNEISGIRATENEIYARLTSTNVIDKEVGLTMVITARRDDLVKTQAAFWGTAYQSGSLVRFEYHNQTQARFVAALAGTPAYWTWDSAVPNDTDYHQYILRVKTLSSYTDIELWVDGVYQGSRQGSTVLGTWTVFGNIYLGFAGRSGSESANLEFTGDLAQLWIGDYDNFDINNFWNNGWLDLGPTGTLGGSLPEPTFYSSLDTPWNNITFWDGDTQITAQAAEQGLPIPDMQAHASLSVNFVGVFLNESHMSAETSMSSTGYKVVDSTTEITATVSLTVSAVTVKNLVSNLESTLSLTSEIGVIKPAAAAFAVQATMFTQAGIINPGNIALTSAFTQVTEATKIDPIRAEAQLSAETALTATGYKIHSVSSTMSATAELIADAVVIPPVRAQAELSAEFSLSAQAQVTRGVISLEASAGTLTVDINRIAGINAGLVTTASITIDAVKKTGIAPTTLQVNGFVLTAGDIINFDAFLTYVIPEENRTLIINAETREYLIEQETREYII